MGLDNGIDVKGIQYEEFPEGIGIDEYFFDDGYGEYNEIEIAYWRKCWNIREDILDILTKDEPDMDDEFAYEVKLKHIPEIINALLKYCDPEYFEERAGETIWEYESIRYRNLDAVAALSWLYFYILDHPDKDVTMTFYDSY